MFPPVLVTALIALGGVCIAISLTIFHYFRDRVKVHIGDNLTSIFSSRETLSFLKGIKEGKVPSVALQDFFNQLLEISKPQQWLKNSWTYFPISGVFFFIVGLLESFEDYSNQIFDYAIYTFLAIAIVFFVFGTWYLIRLGKKLMSF